MLSRAQISFFAAIFSLVGASAAYAQCGPLPYNLANGQVADASQVMANYEALLDCINIGGDVELGLAGEIGVYGVAGSTISGSSLSDVLDNTAGSARGSILYRGASEWDALPPGTSGYFLQSSGSAGDLVWAPTGGGSGGITTIVGAGVSSGSATVALPQYPVVSRPPLSAFTWVNQASATAAEYTNGPLVIRTNQITGGNSLNAFVKSPLGPDWTVTYHYAQGNRTGGTNLDINGVAVYNTVSGRFYVFGLTAGNTVGVWQYSSPTGWAGGPASKGVLYNPSSIWMRMQYVSATTSLSFFYSIDGFTWDLILTTGAPYVGVPDRYGLVVGTQGNAAGSIISLDYMAESSP